MAISAFPLLAAVTEVTSSGSDVPKATIVRDHEQISKKYKKQQPEQNALQESDLISCYSKCHKDYGNTDHKRNFIAECGFLYPYISKNCSNSKNDQDI